MTFQNRDVSLQEFMSQLRSRVQQNKGDLVLFDMALQHRDRFRKQVQEMLGANDDWDGIVNAGNFDEIYPLAAQMLRDLASNLYSEAHPTIYEDANKVSTMFSEQLNETFQATGKMTYDLIPIKSWADIMSDAGLVRIEDGMVTPVPLDELPAEFRPGGPELE
jgi:hypothetical protein